MVFTLIKYTNVILIQFVYTTKLKVYNYPVLELIHGGAQACMDKVFCFLGAKSKN